MTSHSRAAREVVGQFALPGEVVSFEALPGGHINASFRVCTKAAGAPQEFLLQQVNPRVFQDGAAVMRNVSLVTQYLARHARSIRGGEWRRYVLELIPTMAGDSWHPAKDGSVWRVYRYIGGARTYERVPSLRHAEAASRAFGLFLARMAEYDGPPLAATIPGFHDTAARFDALEHAAARDPMGRRAECAAELEQVLAGRPLSTVLPPLLADGSVPVRIVHNDAKLANVLFDAASDEPLCVIDLDTVMPGSALHDLGDLVRSMVTAAAEDEAEPSRVEADPAAFEAIVRGYSAGAGDALTRTERSLPVFAARLIVVEQAARFLSDHLEGDCYYRVDRPGHNLQRARAQIALFASLTAQEAALTRIALRCASARDAR